MESPLLLDDTWSSGAGTSRRSFKKEEFAAKIVNLQQEQHKFFAQDAKYKRTRRDLLHAEYVEGQKGGGVGQPEAGFKVSVLLAKINALCASCWDARNCCKYVIALQCAISQVPACLHQLSSYTAVRLKSSNPR